MTLIKCQSGTWISTKYGQWHRALAICPDGIFRIVRLNPEGNVVDVPGQITKQGATIKGFITFDPITGHPSRATIRFLEEDIPQ